MVSSFLKVPKFSYRKSNRIWEAVSISSWIVAYLMRNHVLQSCLRYFWEPLYALIAAFSTSLKANVFDETRQSNSSQRGLLYFLYNWFIKLSFKVAANSQNPAALWVISEDSSLSQNLQTDANWSANMCYNRTWYSEFLFLKVNKEKWKYFSCVKSHFIC